MSEAHVTDLYIYPIKSFRGVRVETLALKAKGASLDREFMLVDESGLFITQRTMPELARIGLQLIDDAVIELSSEKAGTIDFGLNEKSEKTLEVTVWKSTIPAVEVSAEVSEWLSELLGKKVTLVRTMGDSFFDSAPLLVLSKASLKNLEKVLGTTVTMSRFRPNIVVDGVEAHAEDQWQSGFSIGRLSFQPVKPCTRCKLVTVHPLTGQVGEEPLKTLSTYRRGEKGITFGYLYANVNEGLIHQGSALTLPN